MDLLKGRKKKQAQDWKERQGDCWSDTNIEYATRFEDILKSLRFRLANLEQDLDSTSQRQDKQKAVLDILTEIRNTKEAIRCHETNLQSAKCMPAVRSPKAPVDIPNHNVWNDCWYDKNRKLYITYNKYFKKIRDIYHSEHQQKYEQETSDDGIAVREFKVKFFYGYPACKVTYQDETFVWFLLPTITDNMLTREIVKARLAPDSDEEAIMYQTELKPWIEIGDGKLILTEQEYELGKDLGRYTYAPMDAVKALFNKN